MLTAVMLTVVMPIAVMLNAAMLTAIMLTAAAQRFALLPALSKLDCCHINVCVCLCGAVIDRSVTVRGNCRLFVWCCDRLECDSGCVTVRGDCRPCGAVMDGSVTVRGDCRLFVWCCYR
jgi:hypothetical protein